MKGDVTKRALRSAPRDSRDWEKPNGPRVSKKRLSKRRRRESFGDAARGVCRAKTGNARDASFATYLLRDARGSFRLRLERRVVLRSERRGVASERLDGAPRNVAGA